MHCELSVFVLKEERVDSVRRSAVDSTYYPGAPITVNLADQSEGGESGGRDGNCVVAWLQDTFAPVDLVRQGEPSAVDGQLSLRLHHANAEQADDQGGQQHFYSRNCLVCSHGFSPFSSSAMSAFGPLTSRESRETVRTSIEEISNEPRSATP